MWNRMVTIKDYPEWVKFCKNVMVTNVEEGAIFYDVTTLLWIPLRIKHVITKLNPYEELCYFLTLPGGGKMWNTFSFSQQDMLAQIHAEIKFDLGTKIANATVGHALEKRWEDMMRSSFPEIEEIKRLR